MNLKWNAKLQLMNNTFLIMIYKMQKIMLNLMKRHQRNLLLLLKWFHKCKVLIKIMFEFPKFYLKVVQNLISIIIIITIIIIQIAIQILCLIFNKKLIQNKQNTNNHLNQQIMKRILIRVCIMETACSQKRDIVPSVIKIKLFVLNIVENVIDVQHCMIIIVHG